ncbi:MAG TPA: DUF5818 domain-containing protein [Terriglobia bacterium]|nr:DUF5818 domain-containing protein [Terriglobia bacterium]
MRKQSLFVIGFVLTASLGLAAGIPGKEGGAAAKTFVGNISDSMCGLKHMMPGGDKACTEECVKGGSKYVLADTVHSKVYQLSDQDKAKAFPGAKVKVTGTLKGDTIEVSSIAAAK